MGSFRGRIGASNAIAITNTSQPSANQAPIPNGFLRRAAACAAGTETTAAISWVAASTGSPSYSSSVARSCAALCSGSGMANPRVEDRVQDVDGEVDQHIENRDHCNIALHGDVLLRSDGLEQREPHTWQLENHLDDDGAADEGADVQARNGQQREARRSKGMAEEDAPIRNALRLRGGDEILPQRGDHVGSQ